LSPIDLTDFKYRLGHTDEVVSARLRILQRLRGPYTWVGSNLRGHCLSLAPFLQ